MKKIGLICLAVVLAVGVIGIGYASWTDTVVVQEDVTTGNVCVEFGQFPCSMDDDDAPPPYLDPPYDWTCDPGFGNIHQSSKNVAWGECRYVDTDTPADGINDTLQITLHDVYPCYYNHVTFSTHNCGSIPVVLSSVTVTLEDGTEYDITSDGQKITMDLNSNGTDDFEIWWGDHIGDQLEPCISWDYSFAMHMLQDEDPAIQGTSLKFWIYLEFVQWNMAP